MAAIPPSDSNPTGKDQNAPGATPLPFTFEDQLHAFWQKNRMIVLGLCAFVLLAIVGKGVWEHLQEQKRAELAKAYAAAASPAQLRAFANANAGTELAALAEIRIADEAYASGKAAEAVGGYDKAISTLNEGPLAARARVGRALAKLQSGKAAEAESELKQIAGDANQYKAARAEAAHQLAVLAAEAGKWDDMRKYVEQINQIDPTSLWAQRAMVLQAGAPKSAAPAAPAQPAAGATDAGPNVQIKLPGK